MEGFPVANRQQAIRMRLHSIQRHHLGTFVSLRQLFENRTSPDKILRKRRLRSFAVVLIFF